MKKKYPIAHKVTTSSFFLGTFAGITEEKLDYIEKIVNDFMDKYR
jgi:dTDP-4-amino-4,6-dideoxygalactose transaminase